MSESFRLSRRGFFKVGLLAGVSVYIAPWGQQAFAELFEEKLLTPVRWDPATHHTDFRIDGIAKVTGQKVFARDVRARDMPHWPAQQGHAFIVRIPLADRIYLGFDVGWLGSELQPDKIVTAVDLAQDKLELPTFYGSEPFLAIGKQALYLGQPVAMLIYRDFARFNSAKQKMKFNESQYLHYGATVAFREYDPYASSRYIRVAGASRQGSDVYSAVKDTTIYGHYDPQHRTVWPEANSRGKLDEQGMAFAELMRQELAHPPDNWLVMKRNYFSQSVDQSAMEPDNANGWYDADDKTLHLVVSSQSPAEVADSVTQMLAHSHFGVQRVFIYPCHTVGYGSKDHSIFPLYGLIAALYASGPVRLANDRFEQFQSTMKRHSFNMERSIAVDKHTGLFQILQSTLVSDGGGRANFSADVAACAATSSQSAYYFPRNDLAVISNYSRAVEAGSMRGYGTLQSMTATEMLVDELAQALNMDAIELRRKNALRSGDLNSQGVAPGGAERVLDTLRQAQQHALWRERHGAKEQYERDHPGRLYGVGFACVQKGFGSGAESSFAQIEIDTKGKVTLHHSATEIGTGMSTSQAVNCARWLGRPAEAVHTSKIDWPELPLTTSADPFLMSQSEQDRLQQNPTWTPAMISPASASNSAYFASHTTLEACRLIFLQGLWPAALSIWQQGIEGGSAASYVLRPEDARWTEHGLSADGMAPLPLEQLAAVAHEKNLLTGVVVHAFNRWQWAEASYQIAGEKLRLPLDGVAVRWGGVASYRMLDRAAISYPPTQRNNAGETNYSAVAALVALAVETGTGRVEVLHHHHVIDCGTPIVPELVLGQLQGGVAMGIGHALYEYLPLYEDGPGNGTWNFNRYHLPSAQEVAVWNQTAEFLPPVSATDPSKGIAEVVMIPIVAAIANAIHHATGQRFYQLPISADSIREKLS